MSRPRDAVAEAEDALVAAIRGILDVAAQIFEAALHSLRRARRRSHSIVALYTEAAAPRKDSRRAFRRT